MFIDQENLFLYNYKYNYVEYSYMNIFDYTILTISNQNR